MTVREIQGHLEEMYGTEISPSLISSVTEAVMEEVKAWQSRPLDTLYPIVYMDFQAIQYGFCQIQSHKYLRKIIGSCSR